MKPKNLLIIGFCSFLTLFIADQAKSQINVQTDNAKIQTDSAGGISISTDNTKIDVAGERKTIKTNNNVYDWDDYYFDRQRVYRRRQQPRSIRNHNHSSKTCYQESRQTTEIVGSHRRVEQSSTSNCY